MKIAVVTDSGSGYTAKEAQENGLFFLPLQVIVKDKMYLDGVDLYTEELYEMLRNGEMPTTSMPPMGRIEELFEKLKEEGYEAVIAVPLTAGLSSTSSVMQAASNRHDVDLRIINCYSTCMIQRYLADSAKALADKGYDADEIVQRLNVCVEHSDTLIIPDDLQHLKRGGRLTPLAAALGGLLKIKPVLKLNEDREGKIDVFDKVRTMSKAMSKAVSTFSEANLDENYQLFVLHSGVPEEGNKLKEMLKDSFANNDVYCGLISAVISSHTGLGCLGIQYIKKIEI